MGAPGLACSSGWDGHKRMLISRHHAEIFFGRSVSPRWVEHDSHSRPPPAPSPLPPGLVLPCHLDLPSYPRPSSGRAKLMLKLALLMKRLVALFICILASRLGDGLLGRAVRDELP